MPDASYFANQAERCRELAGRATNTYVSEQLDLWADEFEALANALTLSRVLHRGAPRFFKRWG
jgi:hypothetical protein